MYYAPKSSKYGKDISWLQGHTKNDTHSPFGYVFCHTSKIYEVNVISK